MMGPRLTGQTGGHGRDWPKEEQGEQETSGVETGREQRLRMPG